jgi:hypothetical protein
VAGKGRLDALEEKVAALKARAGGDQLAAWLRDLSDDELADLERRLDAGTPPALALMEMMTE